MAHQQSHGQHHGEPAGDNGQAHGGQWAQAACW
jgi:hypothetical protein